MNLLKKLWRDEAGYILSAEAALLGTLGVVGATVGLGAVSQSVTDELTEVAYAFRSLDQSYCIEGMTGCGSCTAASGFTQQDVKTSHAELDRWIAEQRSDGRDSPATDENVAPPLPADAATGNERPETSASHRHADEELRKKKKSDGKPKKQRKKKRKKNKKRDKS